jgi:phospholipid transport system substrate-binding protein
MIRSLAAFALSAFLLAPVYAAGAPELGPEELVRQVTSDVLETVQKDRQLAAGDRRKVLALAEEKILPLIDFEEATRLAVGKNWRTATPEQRNRLITEFRSMLVRIYSNAVGAYKGQTLRVQPVRMAPGATEVTVRNQYLSPGKPPVSIDYAMHRANGTWQIYDITAEGISLVLTFRGEFEQVVQQAGVDGLIKRLAEKNAPAG